MWEANIQEQELREFYWKNTAAIDGLYQLVSAVRQHNMHQVNCLISSTARGLQPVLTGLLDRMDIFAGQGLSWGADYLASVLTSLEQAQTMEDYILLGDLYELQMIPALQDVQAIISGMDIPLENPDWWRGNLDVLQQKNQALYQALCGLEREYGAACPGILAEPTSVGFFTMALEEEGKRRYLHSNRNPLEEARIWAKRNYRLDREKYTLFGFGMGYHAEELLRQYEDMDLIIIEPDLGILYTAFHFNDCRRTLDKADLVWGSAENWRTALTDREREVVFYRPEVFHVKEAGVRSAMEQTLQSRDAIEDSERLFYQNFRENICRCDGYVDDIREQVQGKRVIIVAGGPSLDKNIHQLRQRPADVVVLAVGTVYKLLEKMKIPVDYVVISDTRVYYQIEGISGPPVPVLLLSTADRRISRLYPGRKYLVCQQGYGPAASWARDRNYTLYDSGGSVATLALDIAIRMGAASVAFVGLDLAYYGTQMHASGTARATFRGYEHRRVQGWDGTDLNTSQTFLRFRKWLEERIRRPDATMKIVDATEGGIRKAGFVPMSLEEYLKDEAAPIS